MDKPKMSNHAHGLWGYWGETEDGRELTIQSLGIGGPSAAMVLAQLAGLGVKRAVGVGTCRALDPGCALGDVLVVERGDRRRRGEPRAGAAASRRSPRDPPARGRRAGCSSASRGGRRQRRSVASTDLLGELDGRAPERWRQRGAAALEMVSAPLFATGARCGIAAAALLAVSDAGGEAIAEEPLQEASMRMGRLALAALSSSG